MRQLNNKVDFNGIILVSFGGPKKNSDVMPFLRNVTRGKNISDSRLEAVAQHYYHFNGQSPIVINTEKLLSDFTVALRNKNISLPVYYGNRNWDFFLADALETAYRAGSDKLLAVITSAYTSYSGKEQYYQDIVSALEQKNLLDKITVYPIREFFNHPGFSSAFIKHINSAIQNFLAAKIKLKEIELLFCTHSIPIKMVEAIRINGESNHNYGGWYREQHKAVMEYVVKNLTESLVSYQLVYQSRSSQEVDWLEPDINDVITELAARGKKKALIVVPIGFIVDHMEVVWDLDIEARELAQGLGLEYVRINTPGKSAEFIAALVELIEERIYQIPYPERNMIAKEIEIVDPPALGKSDI